VPRATTEYMRRLGVVGNASGIVEAPRTYEDQGFFYQR
jgi:hypothetical protein